MKIGLKRSINLLFGLVICAGISLNFSAPIVKADAQYNFPFNCGFSRPLLGRGNAGACVKAIQWALNRGGSCETLNPDGIFGPATERVARNFQAGRGLQVDGIVGSQTWWQLDRLMRYIDEMPGGKGGCW